MLWSHRACQGAKKKKKGKDKRQHLSHCLSYVFCVFFSVASQWLPLMGCEFLRPHYCQRGERRKKEIPALCLDTVPFVFCRRSLLFLFVVLFRWSVCSTHFNRLMFTRGGGGGGGAGAGCCDIHASVVWVSSFFFNHSECLLFWYTFFVFLLLLLKKKKEKWHTTTYRLVFCRCGIDHTVLASGRPAGLKPFLTASRCRRPIHLFFPTPLEHKMQSAKAFLPFTELSSCYSYLFCLFVFYSNFCDAVYKRRSHWSWITSRISSGVITGRLNPAVS